MDRFRQPTSPGGPARTFKCLWGPGIDSKERIPPAYVAWRAGTKTLFLLGSYSPHRLCKNSSWAGICSRVKGWKIDSWNRLGNKFEIEEPMSHVHVKINFSFGIDSWNRCLSVHKRLQIRALYTNMLSYRAGYRFLDFWKVSIYGLWTVAMFAMAVKHSNHSATLHLISNDCCKDGKATDII